MWQNPTITNQTNNQNRNPKHNLMIEEERKLASKEWERLRNNNGGALELLCRERGQWVAVCCENGQSDMRKSKGWEPEEWGVRSEWGGVETWVRVGRMRWVLGFFCLCFRFSLN